MALGDRGGLRIPRGGDRAGGPTDPALARPGRPTARATATAGGAHMNDPRLRRELEQVSLRYRRLLLRTASAACLLALAAAGGAVLARLRGAGYVVPAALLLLLVAVPLVVVPLLLAALRAIRDPAWMARRIECRFPDLDARLLAALEQHPDESQQSLGFLQETVV